MKYNHTFTALPCETRTASSRRVNLVLIGLFVVLCLLAAIL